VTVVLAALLAGTAAALMLPAPCAARLAAVLADRPAAPPTSAGPLEHAARASRPISVLLASLVAGLGVGLLVGGPVGVLLGGGAAVTAWVVLRRLEPRAVRRRREQVAADLPTAVDLLGACLAAGRPPTEALAAVASAVDGPLACDLQVVAVRLHLGADPVSVWRGVGRQPGALASLGRTIARSLETGAPMAEGLHLLAVDLRRRRRAAADQQARTVGVRAAAPLGLCFLPAFVLVGIVPSIVSAFATLSWW
jgi:Flp pilus assembly protein TadB